MAYRSFEQSSAATSSNATGTRRKQVTPSSLLAASQIFKRSRFLLPLGAASAAFALGISAYASGEKLGRIPYKNSFVAENSILKDPVLKDIFYCGNNQHIYSSLAIMAAPFTASKPFLTSALLLSGMAIFCGTQYYRSFIRRVESAKPLLMVGGLCLFSGWLAFLL